MAGALAAVTVGAAFLFDMLPGGGSTNNTGSKPPASSGATDTPEPGAQDPTDAATPSGSPSGTQLAELPSQFIGTWQGPTTEQSTGQPHGTVTAAFTAGRTGSDVVLTTSTIEVLGTKVECHGVGKLLSGTAGEVRIEERTDPRKPGTAGLCTSGTAELVFTLGSDGKLTYQSEEAAAGRPSGTLTKQ